MQARAYKMPIYITETGIADKSDRNRATMIERYMEATLQAIKDGADVRGFYYWTLVDNFEWNAGYLMEFGLYAWQPDGSVDRVLKEGAKPLVRFYHELPNTMSEMKAAVKSMVLKSYRKMHEESEAAMDDARAKQRKKHRPVLAAT